MSFYTDGSVWKKLIFESRFYMIIGLFTLVTSCFLIAIIEEDIFRSVRPASYYSFIPKILWTLLPFGVSFLLKESK